VKICNSQGQVTKLRDGPCGNEGDICGGLAGFQCASGFVCRYENGQTTPPYPDAAGTCSNRAYLGEMCGGIRGIQCASDLVCIYEMDELLHLILMPPELALTNRPVVQEKVRHVELFVGLFVILDWSVFMKMGKLLHLILMLLELAAIRRKPVL
jgi:hypothetical protein